LAELDRLIGDILSVSSTSTRHKGLAAAVGVRRNLYPDAPPYAGEPPRASDPGNPQAQPTASTRG
jgi:hypothetical protein